MTTPNPQPSRKRGKKAGPATSAPQSDGTPVPTPPRSAPAKPVGPVKAPPIPPDPAIIRDTSDPGDATHRNFRYQHAYGVILLAGAKRGERSYLAIWCEHHEDLLAQRADGCYDGYQIKTSRPENGTWRMLDGEIVKTIGRFVDLVREFGSKIGELFFVTNTEFDDVADDHKDEKRRSRRPEEFLVHVRGCARHTDISALYRATFTEIQGQCGCQADELFVVLKKMNLILGPSRDSFPSVVAHEHLGKVEECKALAPAALDKWRDHLIAVICAASSLAVTDPIRHLRPLIDAADIDPTLVGKKIVVAEVMDYNSYAAADRPFIFPGTPQIQLGGVQKPHILQAKLEHGKIGDQFDYLRARELAAESHLMEDAHREPKDFPKLLRQLEELVLGECSEAHLRARTDGEPYGERMLIAVQDRLKHLASNEPKKVYNKSYECLMGLVALLTTDTRVWWSTRFPIQEAA